ncbi:DNA polymerase/3'-5' exonuclease PolX (plasmid) [Peptoclostridium acidaminophilum DSM 3953]|uniref:DNA polymerase beta n=1 Tax=Peptoclostridium acidaminophilum DSM 3953 TaxID=1286171 RepID=W8UC04_PEPAC|nr:DNA polymerase/3'-5' exonuclease PolX [Peptoclostridium acidaminophilum]AHM58251.1 DNA polymerase/3'-5' exonuclease PolX [Peptoclostridium acidaminophilum DSM 3953]
MAVNNAYISKLLSDYADMLELEGANRYKIRAYRNASYSIASLPRSISEMVELGEDLTQLPGIGKELSQKLVEIAGAGRLHQFEEIKERFPEGLLEILKLRGIGFVKVRELYEKLGIKNLSELEEAAREGRVSQIRGFDVKTERMIIEEIEAMDLKKGAKPRIKISTAESIVMPLIDHLKKSKGVKSVEIAGSFRRGRETVGDIDILVVHDGDSDVMDRFAGYEDVEQVLEKGDTLSSAVLRLGLQVDLRAVPEISSGSALHHFTGSKEHNVAMRQLAIRKGLKISEYGIFRGDERIGGENEEDVFSLLDLQFIPPELRENTGEIEAAQKGKLPKLISLEDIKGDLHMHSKASDGRATIEEMALAARERGYEYIAITDHSRRLRIARGLTPKRLEEQLEQIDLLNERLEGIRVLKSIEVDILEDGTLDLPDSILSRLDLVVCAVHHKFNLSKAKQTDRIISAIDNPYFTILAHPTGRLIDHREPYELDMERLMKAARECGCVMELNMQPDRLDLNEIHCRMAKELGVMVALSTDAHITSELNLMRLGIKQARRGWLEADDVINTMTLEDLMKLINAKKR